MRYARARTGGSAWLSRRTVLIGGAAATGGLALGGCRFTHGGSASASPPAQVSSTMAGTLRLLAAYDAAVAAFPQLVVTLSPLRAEHASHLAALAQLAGVAVPSLAPGTPVPTGLTRDPGTALGALKATEAAAQADATQACLTAPAPYAALLGSVAACRATHQEVLG